MPHKTITTPDRDRIKSLVPTGNTEQIQVAMDTGLYKRKRRKVAEVDEDNHQIVFTATSDTLDRDSERVIPRSFEKDMGYYDENPVVLYGHDHRLPAVGKCTDHEFSDADLKMQVKFAVEENPMAALLWGLYKSGYMRMTSVGFIPIEWSDDAEEKLEGQSGLTFTRNELIELSLVNVGSNRYALSELPAEIKGDPVLRDAYAWMVEGDTAHKTKSIVSATEFIAFPETTGGLPINLNVSVSENTSDNGDPKEVKTEMATQLSENRQCPTCQQAKEDQGAAPETKGVNLATELNTIIDGADEDRDEMIRKLADACDMDTDGITAILDGEMECPTKEVIEGLARGCGVTADKLFDAAMQDGCAYDGMDTEENMSGDTDTDEDKAFDAFLSTLTDTEEPQDKAFGDFLSKTVGAEVAKTKFYGMLSGMFPESYEERQQAIYADLEQYLEYMIEDIDKYDYVEAYPIATYPDHVIVYCWNTNKIYKASYEMADGEVDFTDLKLVKLNYEEMAMDMKQALADEDFTEPTV